MEIKREITLTATSKTEDGTAITAFRGTINTDDPSGVTYTAGIMNQGLYRSNREKVKTDQTAFEDALYAEQDRMIALAAAEGQEEE